MLIWRRCWALVWRNISRRRPTPTFMMLKQHARDAVRDTTFGYLLRAAFGSSILPHPDEENFDEIWRKSVHRAHHDPPEHDQPNSHDEIQEEKRGEVRVEKKREVIEESHEVDERSPSHRQSRASDDATLIDDPELHPSHDKPGQSKVDEGPPPAPQPNAELNWGNKSPVTARDNAENSVDYLLVDWYCDMDPDVWRCS